MGSGIMVDSNKGTYLDVFDLQAKVGFQNIILLLNLSFIAVFTHSRPEHLRNSYENKN